VVFFHGSATSWSPAGAASFDVFSIVSAATRLPRCKGTAGKFPGSRSAVAKLRDAGSSSRSDPEELKDGSAARAGSLHFGRSISARRRRRRPAGQFYLGHQIFTVAFMIARPVELPVIANITKGSAAEAAGIRWATAFTSSMGS
jgi:hypothetical protein